MADTQLTDDGGDADDTPPPDGGDNEYPKSTGSRCPRIDLGATVPVTYSGDTSDSENLVSSTRLEWGPAPDDALKLTAPETGEYLIELSTSIEDFSVGASSKDYQSMESFAPKDCPPSGATIEIDGVYTDNQPDFPEEWQEGQTVLIFISAATWSDVSEGTYELTIRKK